MIIYVQGYLFIRGYLKKHFILISCDAKKPNVYDCSVCLLQLFPP
jgi:hypothetical protein